MQTTLTHNTKTNARQRLLGDRLVNYGVQREGNRVIPQQFNIRFGQRALIGATVCRR